MRTESTTLVIVSLLSLGLSACGRTGVFPLAGEPAPGDVIEDSDLSLSASVCGDGVVQWWAGETCDNGPDNSDIKADACRTDCLIAYCGDGVLDEFEACDDGNIEEDDFCTNDCLFPPTDPCSPCEIDGDCGETEDYCLPLLDGWFCGLNCIGEGSCPDGFACTQMMAPFEEYLIWQCLPELGVCSGCFDQDEDGFGVGALCLGTDCNDADSTINPLALEWCDGVDNDCDGIVDEDDAEDALEWYADVDEDDFGDPLNITYACHLPDGFLADNTDCDDLRSDINPAALEICDDLDNNCNEENDEGCPPDLIVDGETVEMTGAFLFDRVEVLNGGEVIVTPFDGEPGVPGSGTEGAGCLEIEARIVYVREGSGFNADGAGGAGLGTGESGGFGGGFMNVGPGGGSYGGAGGSGEGVSGGVTYGTVDGMDIEQGADGGNFSIVEFFGSGACDSLTGLVSHGGHGGGCIRLDARTIEVSGYIHADGTDGEGAKDGSIVDIVDGAGGGSGGGVLLLGQQITIGRTGFITAEGGSGGSGGTYSPPEPVFDEGSCIGNGGGGGGGGRVKFIADTVISDGVIDVSGGSGGSGPQSDSTGGGPGTVFGDE